MRLYFAPGFLFVIGIVTSLALLASVVFIATSQPWLGVRLGLDTTAVVLSRVDDTGPLNSQLPGTTLISVGGTNVAPVRLSPIDVIEEPDTIGNVDRLKAFYASQSQMFGALESGQVSLVLANAGTNTTVVAVPRNRRPMASLPLGFWTQLAVGFVGLVIGVWVTSVRPRDLAARMVLLAGIGLALSAWAAAIYSSREIALSHALFTTASRVNSTGTLIFGIGMVTLFLISPRVIVPKALLILPTVLIGGLIVFIQSVNWPNHVGALQDGVVVTMGALLVAIAAQIALNRRDPAARAMLGWLGLSVALGAGGFVLTIIIPTLLGQELWLAQSTAFLFFLIIYAGIALGVARYRLFDLCTWSFSVFFYGIGVALLLLLDAALIYGISVERAPAFGIALAVVGGVYLPMRRHAARWMGRKDPMSAEQLYRRVTEISFGTDALHKQSMLGRLWQDLFSLLSVTPLVGQDRVDTALVENGAALLIAPVLDLPALRLEWAENGTRLFSTQDLIRAKSINTFIDTSLRQNKTYLDAVEAERIRINRDMHDNIGLLLISALHVDNMDRKDALIRQTLADLREIVSNPDQSNRQLPQLIADLRAEISSHMDVADIAVDWHIDSLPDIGVDPLVVHTVQALMREGTNNIIRHSGGRKATIRIQSQGVDIAVSLRDDGRGIERNPLRDGTGLANLASRLARLGGTFDVASDTSGTTLTACIPLRWIGERAAE